MRERGTSRLRRPLALLFIAAACILGAGAVAAASARDDDRPDLVVGIGPIERLDQLAAHRRRPRVQALRAVERDRQDAVGERGRDLLEGHCPTRRR